MAKYKPKRNCFKCDDKYIDCRNYMFCSLKGLKYIGRKKEHKTTPEWCPKWILFNKIVQKLKRLQTKGKMAVAHGAGIRMKGVNNG